MVWHIIDYYFITFIIIHTKDFDLNYLKGFVLDFL